MSLDFRATDGVIKCNGQRVYLKGANWFGLENHTFSLHGLWAVSFESLVDFLEDNKFNAVRLPISVECVEKWSSIQPTAVNSNFNPNLINITVEEFIDRVITRFKQAGILVMWDMHLLKASTVIPDLWYDNEYPEDRVIRAWVKLVNRFERHWNVFAADLKNEPHGIATWGEGPSSGPNATDWAAAAERMGNAVLDACPRLLIFVEGVDGRDKADSWWGGYFGFIRHNNRPVQLKLRERLVYSPHVYGPSVWPKPMFAANDFPRNMLDDWEEQWGFLKKSRRNPPICIGEWGGQATNTTGSDGARPDLTWQQALAEFLALNDIRDTFYWALNANSGDTKGLVKDDWRTPETTKLQIINHVCPYPTSFKNAQPVTRLMLPPPRPWNTTLPGLRPMPTDFDSSQPANNPPSQNTPSNSTPAAPSKPPVSPAVPTNNTSQGVAVAVSALNSWQEGGRTHMRCDVTITNNTKAVLGSQFRLQEVNPACSITQMWSMNQRGNLELLGFPSFVIDNGGLRPGQSHKFGVVCAGGQPNFNIIARG